MCDKKSLRLQPYSPHSSRRKSRRCWRLLPRAKRVRPIAVNRIYDLYSGYPWSLSFYESFRRNLPSRRNHQLARANRYDCDHRVLYAASSIWNERKREREREREEKKREKRKINESKLIQYILKDIFLGINKSSAYDQKASDSMITVIEWLSIILYYINYLIILF